MTELENALIQDCKHWQQTANEMTQKLNATKEELWAIKRMIYRKSPPEQADTASLAEVGMEIEGLQNGFFTATNELIAIKRTVFFEEPIARADNVGIDEVLTAIEAQRTSEEEIERIMVEVHDAANDLCNAADAGGIEAHEIERVRGILNDHRLAAEGAVERIRAPALSQLATLHAADIEFDLASYHQYRDVLAATTNATTRSPEFAVSTPRLKAAKLRRQAAMANVELASLEYEKTVRAAGREEVLVDLQNIANGQAPVQANAPWVRRLQQLAEKLKGIKDSLYIEGMR